MYLIRKSFQFFVFSNLFIACLAVLMLMQTELLLLGEWPGFNLVGFVFTATISSYSFHWLLTPADDSTTPRVEWLRRYRKLHFWMLLVSGIAVAWFAAMLIQHWPWLLLSAFVTFLYSAPKIPHPLFRSLRKVALGKTIFLAFVWMFVTTLLPLLVSGVDWRGEFTLFSGARFFLIYAICILFDYRDREYDRSVGIRSLITWLPKKWILALFLFSLLVFMGLNMAMLLYGYSIKVVSTLLLPGIITGLLYRRAIRDYSDWLYYFVLDGLMALSSLLTILGIR